jgi:hypothetical protein
MISRCNATARTEIKFQLIIIVFVVLTVATRNILRIIFVVIFIAEDFVCVRSNDVILTKKGCIIIISRVCNCGDMNANTA